MSEPWGQGDIDDFVACLRTTPDAPGYYLVPMGKVGRFLLEIARCRAAGSTPAAPKEPAWGDYVCTACGAGFRRLRSQMHTDHPTCSVRCRNIAANRRRQSHPPA